MLIILVSHFGILNLEAIPSIGKFQEHLNSLRDESDMEAGDVEAIDKSEKKD